MRFTVFTCFKKILFVWSCFHEPHRPIPERRPLKYFFHISVVEIFQKRLKENIILSTENI